MIQLMRFQQRFDITLTQGRSGGAMIEGTAKFNVPTTTESLGNAVNLTSRLNRIDLQTKMPL